MLLMVRPPSHGKRRPTGESNAASRLGFKFQLLVVNRASRQVGSSAIGPNGWRYAISVSWANSGKLPNHKHKRHRAGLGWWDFCSRRGATRTILQDHGWVVKNTMHYPKFRSMTFDILSVVEERHKPTMFGKAWLTPILRPAGQTIVDGNPYRKIIYFNDLCFLHYRQRNLNGFGQTSKCSARFPSCRWSLTAQPMQNTIMI